MGYALLFARQLANTAKKNRLNYEIMYSENRKKDIASQMTVIQQCMLTLPKDSQDINLLEFQKQMLTNMSNFLDTRIASLKAQVQKAAAEEQPLAEALAKQVAASAPKYVGR